MLKLSTTGRNTAHVTNSCTFHKKPIIARQNALFDHLKKWLPEDGTYYKVQRFGNLQPNFVIEKEDAIIKADVKVTIEHPKAMATVKIENEKKYEALREHMTLRGKPTTTKIPTFGAIGSVSMSTKQQMNLTMGNDRKAITTLRHLSRIAVDQSRNITVHHLTGIGQSY